MRALHTVATVAALLSAAVPEGLDSCAIATDRAVFSAAQRPADLNQFLAGRVGVLQRGFKQIYLIGAFRILSGLPLTPEETKSLYYSTPAYAPYPDATHYKILSTPSNGYILNCLDDAFRAADETLANLSSRWGSTDARTQEWQNAQQQVFSDCSSSAPVIPEAVTPGMDPLLAAHRRYQIAAAHFYSGQFRMAAEAFDQIAIEPGSPWRDVAPYLAARALLRAGQLDGDQDAYRDGADRLRKILNDPAQSGQHAASQRLLNYARLRMEPEARLAELDAALRQPGPHDLSQTAIDFRFALNRSDVPQQVNALGPLDESRELTEWLRSVFMQYRPADAGERSVAWWQKTRNPAWLIAALASADEKDLDELLQAGGRIQPGAPAYESIAYYAISREMARGHRDEARAWADRALSQNLLRSSRNLMLAERTRLAVNWTEFLRFGLRSPAPKMAVVYGYQEALADKPPLPTGTAPVFPVDVLEALETSVPFSLWVDATRNPLVPAEMQLRIAQTGWVRAMVLGRFQETREMIQRVAELQPASADVARGIVAAHDLAEAAFAAHYAVLRNVMLPSRMPSPEADVLNLSPARYATVCQDYPFAPVKGGPNAAIDSTFLIPEQKRAGAAEWAQLQETEPWNATFLLRKTLDWATAHPEDPRVPEALHRAVWRSNNACNDAATGTFSKQAYDLLHRRYPASKWTEQTKYWYK